MYVAHGMNAFLLSALLIGWLRPSVVRIGLVDRPDARKLHDGPVPICGGIAIFVSFLLTNMGLDAASRVPPGIVAGLAVIAVTGLIDDRWGLPALPRLVIHVFAACAMLLPGGEAAINLAAAAPEALVGAAIIIAPIVAVVFVVGLINAINMTDGVDGLAGGTVMGAFAWIALFAWHAGSVPIATEAFLLVCAVAGFLVFNMRHRWRSRAAVYMGDMGSMMLGAALACFIVLLSSGDSHTSFPTLAWVVIVPVADTLLLILRRVAAGRSPLRPDRQHLHHLLLDNGFSPMATMAIIVAAGFVCGGVGYAGYVFAVPSGWMCAGLLVPVGLHAGFVLLLTGAFSRLHHVAGAALPPIAAAFHPVGRGRS